MTRAPVDSDAIMCGSRKYPYPTTEDSLICTPHPQDFPDFLNRDFADHPLEFQSGFGTLKTKKVNTNSVSYENTVESYYNSAE